MRKIFMLMALFVSAVCTKAANGAEVPQVTNVCGRSHVMLNGEWSYIVALQNVGYYDYRLAKYARTQDYTRLISMVMEVTSADNYKNRLQDNLNQYVDVMLQRVCGLVP